MSNSKSNHYASGHSTYVATVGLAVVDHVFQVETLPTLAEKHFASTAHNVVGGIATNAALAVLNLGGRAKLFTRVGNDAAGTFVNSYLKKSGVELDQITVVNNQMTATSAVIVDQQGERMIVNYKPAELFKDPPLLDGKSLLEAGSVLADLRWTVGTREIFKLAKARNIPTILDFDLAPDEIPDEVFNNTSHIIFAEAALRRFTKKTDLSAALRVMNDIYPHILLAVTAGANGILFMNRDSRIQHIQSRPVKVVSTLGAGDVFHGAAALALKDGKSFEHALRFANDVSAVMVAKPTTGNRLPTLNEVEELQRSYK